MYDTCVWMYVPHSTCWKLEDHFVAFSPLFMLVLGIKLQMPGCKASECILPTSGLAGPKGMLFFFFGLV